MATPAPFLTMAEFYKAHPTASRKFCHLILSHRLQRFTLSRMAVLIDSAQGPISSDDRAKLKAQLESFKSYLAVHSSAEDKILMPQIVELSTGADKDRMLELQKELEAQHAQVDGALPELDAAVNNSDSSREEVRAALQKYTRIYHEHTVFEEDNILAGTNHLSADAVAAIAKAMGGYFREAQGIKYSLWMFNELAKQNPGDEEIFAESMPWFVRNLVTWMLGWTSDAQNFVHLFGTLTGKEDQTLQHFIHGTSA